MHIFWFVLFEKSKDKETIIIMESIKLEKTYWLCIV